MRWHRINEAQVTACIIDPTLEEPALGGKTHSWQRVGNMHLRVTWVREGSNITIVTAVVKARPPEGWNE